MQTDAQPHATTRPPALLVGLALTLFAMVLTLMPAAPANADELPHNFDIEAACLPGDSVPPSGHTDATGTHGPAIDCLVWYGIAEGRTATSFGTNEPVTRAQAAAFIVRTLDEINGFALPPRDRGAFSDVGGESEFARNIERLANVDPPILEGFEDGTFRPSEPIKRDQFASVTDRTIAEVARQIHEVAALPPGTTQFPDVGEESPHFRAISRLADAEVILGREDGTYRPRQDVLRGQTASIIARVLGSLVYVGAVDRPADAPAGTVSGLVHDAENAAPDETGDPMDDITVEIRGDAARSVETDSDGEFSLSLPPGDYEVLVAPDGWMPYLQQVSLSDEQSVALDFRMYRTASVPEDSETTTTEPGDVTVSADGDFWRIPIYIDTPRERKSASDDATEIRLVRADGVILQLGSADTDDSWWSRDADGTSNRTAARNQDGDHTLYYLIDGDWYDLTATFDANGTLVEVNGEEYEDPDA